MNAGASDERRPPAKHRQAARDARGASGRRGRPAGRIPIDAGSLAGVLWRLKLHGVALCIDTPGERRACHRAIARIAEVDPLRHYDIVTGDGNAHTDPPQVVYFLHVRRTA